MTTRTRSLGRRTRAQLGCGRAHRGARPLRAARRAARRRGCATWSRYLPISSRSAIELPDARVELAQVASEQLVEPLEQRARRAADRVDRVQLLDLGERQAERLQALDEAQALELVAAVDAAAAGAAPHARQQAELLVVAQRARGDARLLAHLRRSRAASRGSRFASSRQLASTGPAGRSRPRRSEGRAVGSGPPCAAPSCSCSPSCSPARLRRPDRARGGPPSGAWGAAGMAPAPSMAPGADAQTHRTPTPTASG